MSNYSADQIALQSHIEAGNARTQEWLDAGEGRWAGMVVADPKHWEKDGITTIEGYEHYMLVEDFINLYKSEYNVKPRWMDFDAISLLDLKAMYENLGQEADEAAKNRAERKVKEDAREARLAEELGVSLETYTRWQEEAFGEDDEGWMYYC